MIRRSESGRLLAAALAAAALAACADDGTRTLSEPFDPAAVQADQRALEQVLSSDALAAFEALGLRVERERPLRVVGAAGVPVISDESRGVTFVYDPVQDRYVPDAGRAGAPETGVRFILYDVDAASGRPDVTREVGHADLIDEGDDTPDGPALRFVVTHTGEVVLDYAVAASGGEDAGSVAIDGTLGAGVDRLDFDIDLEGRREAGRESADLAFALEMPERDFAAVARVANVHDTGEDTGEVVLTVRYDGVTFGVELNGSRSLLEGTFSVDGEPFAVVSGDPADPAITRPDGSPLEPEQVRALVGVLQLQEHAFRLLGDLMRPAGDIIHLGIVL
ncbi:MAG: hypothetical protein D6701_08560 [Gemmatimonadetes bacterium]|nr:MAG: hypothetical protein D6701_08560 [Gemmatimonadota bacterium]